MKKLLANFWSPTTQASGTYAPPPLFNENKLLCYEMYEMNKIILDCKFKKGFTNLEAFVVGDQKICIKIISLNKKFTANFLEHQQWREFQFILLNKICDNSLL